MNQIQSILLVFVISVPPLASAQTMNFEAAAAMLGASCGKDIDENCRGVNFDPVRMKECLARNRDSVTPKCQDDYLRAFDAIQQRVKARAALSKMCERDALKLCASAQKDDAKVIQCLLTAPRGVSARCNQAISAAGYR
jgi:hypothetical protein